MSANYNRQRVNVLCLVLMAVAFNTSATAQQIKPNTSTDSGNKGSVTNVDSVHDTIPNSFNSGPIVWASDDVNSGIVIIETKQSLSWKDATKGLEKVVQDQMPTSSVCALTDKSQVYVFHIMHWLPSGDLQSQLVSSGWYAYTLSRGGSLKFANLSGTDDQSVYGKTKVLIIGISGFDKLPQSVDDWKGFAEIYKTSVVQGTPENWKDLGLLISSVGGFGGAKVAGLEAAGTVTPIFVTIGCQLGTAKLPFTLTVSSSTISKAGDKPIKPPSAGSITCSGSGNITPCSAAHSFVSQDKEYWDVSIGVATPGTRETKYTFSGGAVQSSITRHTDLYGMLDIYPGGYWQPKDGAIPHLNVGLPVTSQSFYRPYFGLSESLTGWTTLQRKLSLPIGINFFAGMVYMKTQLLTDNPTSQAEFNADLKYTRVWKPIFGIEVPISSMASKIGNNKSSSNKGGASTGPVAATSQ